MLQEQSWSINIASGAFLAGGECLWLHGFTRLLTPRQPWRKAWGPRDTLSAMAGLLILAVGLESLLAGRGPVGILPIRMKKQTIWGTFATGPNLRTRRSPGRCSGLYTTARTQVPGGHCYQHTTVSTINTVPVTTSVSLLLQICTTVFTVQMTTLLYPGQARSLLRAPHRL